MLKAADSIVHATLGMHCSASDIYIMIMRGVGAYLVLECTEQCHFLVPRPST